MRNRKAAFLGEEMPFYIFYIIYTGMIITAFVFIPQTLLASTSDTHQIETSIFAERMYNQFNSVDLLTGRTYPGQLRDRAEFTKLRAESAFDTVGTPREISFRLSLDGKEIYHKKDLHIRGVALYTRTIQNRPVLITSEDKTATLTIDQVFNPRRTP